MRRGYRDGDRHLMAEHRRADRNRAAGRRDRWRCRGGGGNLLQPAGVTADHGVDGRAAIEPKVGPHFGSYGLARLVDGPWRRIGFGSIRRAPPTTQALSTRSSRSCRCRRALRRMTARASAHRQAGRGAARGPASSRGSHQRTSQLVREGGEELIAALRGLEGRGPETARFVDGLLELPDPNGVRTRPAGGRRRPAGRPSPPWLIHNVPARRGTNAVTQAATPQSRGTRAAERKTQPCQLSSNNAAAPNGRRRTP